jgi:NADH:ubiquinone reductase (H+-translocating)
MSSGKPRVVVVGGGFGGLRAARALGAKAVPVTLVDRNNYNLFQPLLYQVATSGLNPADIAYPLRAVFHRNPYVQVRVGEVTGVDLAEQQVVLADGASLDYDHLVLAAGTVTADFGVPGVAEHALGLNDLPDAVRLRSEVLRRFEEADADRSLLDRGWLTFVVAGGGPTGVEMAGAFAELFKVMAKDYPKLAVERARIVLVEMGPELLPPLSPRAREHARRLLTKRGVEVRTGHSVAGVEAGQVVLDGGETLATRTVVWAAGVRPVALPSVLGLETGRAGRVVVSPDLSVPGHPNIWVIGDLAAAADGDGGLLPQVAQPAIQGGRHVAEQILRRHAGLPTQPFVYRDKGSMATIGRHAAVADLPGNIRLRGILGWLAWLLLHIVTLMGFRNRLSVLVNWAWSYLTWDRGTRLILEPPEPRRGSGRDQAA